MSATSPRRRPTLGFEDLAVLARLRAIALLFRAVRAVRADLCGINISLSTGPTNHIYPAVLSSSNAYHLVATLAGWDDLLATRLGRSPFCIELVDVIHDRLAAVEFPADRPAGLTRLLRKLLAHKGIPPTVAGTLERVGWEAHPLRGLLLPLLPESPSAHEALDAVLAAEATGGLGSGPLALLARQAAALVLGGPP